MPICSQTSDIRRKLNAVANSYPEVFREVSFYSSYIKGHKMLVLG